MFHNSCSMPHEETVPMIGVPTRAPNVPIVDMTAKNRAEKAGSTLAARNGRRVMLVPDPRTVIVKPTTSTQVLGAKAIRNDPIQSRFTLHLDKVRFLATAVRFPVRDRAGLAAGIRPRYRNVDTIALSENRSPA
jgi:hypothetical protein